MLRKPRFLLLTLLAIGVCWFPLTTVNAAPPRQGDSNGVLRYGQTIQAELGRFEGDRWTFDGQVGDRIEITMTSTAIDPYVELRTVEEVILAADDDGGGGLDARLEYVLTTSGVYTIIARDRYLGLGAYTLTLKKLQAPLVATNLLTFGDQTEAVLNNPSGESWFFEGEGGAFVTLTLNSVDFDPYLELYAPDGTLLIEDDDGAGGLNAQISAFLLPESGVYAVVVRDALRTSSGFFALTLEGSQADAVPDTRLSYGDTVTATLLTTELVTWTFVGEADDEIAIRLSSDDFDPYFELYDPSGDFLISDDDSGGNLNAAIENYILPSSGEYRIVVGDYNSSAVGDYTLSLTARFSRNLTLGYGTALTQPLSSVEGDFWTFEGERGDVVTIRLVSTAFDAYLQLFDPTDTLIFVDDDGAGNFNAEITEFTLMVNGRYSILARSFGADSLGEYTLSLNRIRTEDFPPQVLTYGETISASLSAFSGDVWEFEGDAGDVVTISLISEQFDAYLELYSPSGDLLVDNDDGGGSLNARIEFFVLPDSGTYEILARPLDGSSLGEYTLSLEEGEATPRGTLTLNEPVSAQLAGNQSDRWVFEGEANASITITLNSRDFDAYLQLLDASGELLWEDDDGGGSLNAQIANFILPYSGAYTVVVIDYARANGGEYELAVTATEFSEPRLLSYGETVNGNLTANTADEWTFEGQTADIVIITMESTNFDSYLELRDGEGNVLAEDDDSAGNLNALLRVALEDSGTYTIAARSFNPTATGSYALSIRLETPAEQNAIVVGETVESSISNVAGDRWTFAGREGQAVQIVLSSDDFDAYLELYGPNGGLIAQDDDGAGNFNALILIEALPESGTYTIVARSLGSDTIGNYALALTEQTITINEIVFGETVNGTFQNAVGDRWTFEGEISQTVIISASGDGIDAYLELYDPAGDLIAADDDGGEGLNAVITLQLSDEGTYTIVVRNVRETTGTNYTLSLEEDR